jgi:phospholipid-translocating ATPase
LINLLDKIYNTFDQLCQLHGLQKIETVGKTYMCAGGLKETEKDVDQNILSRHHAIRSFELAKDMLDAVQSMTLENGEKLKIKIGLNTGQVIPALVGNHKPQFSLIGDTINTTARMCAYSQDMAINCSEETYVHISKTYNDFTISQKEVKGKGVMNLYLYKPHANRAPIIRESNRSNLIGINIQKKLSSRNLPKQNSIRESRANLIRQASKNSNNLSVFIVENSKEMPDESKNRNDTIRNSINAGPTKKTAPMHLSRTLTTVALDGINNDKLDSNKIFEKSLLFLKFKDPIAKDLYSKFSAIKLKGALFRSKVLNNIYIFIMLKGMYDILDNTFFYSSTFKIVNILKLIFLIAIKILNDNTSKLRESKPKVLQILTMSIYLIFTLIIQLQMNWANSNYLTNIIMEQNITILVVTYTGILNYVQTAYNLVIFIIIFVINISLHRDNPLFVKYLTYEIVICLIIFVFIVTREYISTYEYLQNKIESDKLKSMEKLLYNLMPQHVVQNLKEDIPVADVLYNVTMLFADIVRFTDYSSQRTPKEVVELVSQLFNDFDDACQKLNLYKVHTIGDCYVVISFGKVHLSERNYKDEAEKMIEMGESMIETIKLVRKGVNFEELNMRIGIHTVIFYYNIGNCYCWNYWN